MNLKNGQTIYRVYNIQTLKWFRKGQWSAYHGWTDKKERSSFWPSKGALKEGSLKGARKSHLQVVSETVRLETEPTLTLEEFLKS